MPTPKPITLTQRPAGAYDGPSPQPFEVIGDLISPEALQSLIEAHLAANPIEAGYGN